MSGRDRPGNRIIVLGALSTAGGFGVRLGARFLFLIVAGHLFGAALFGGFSVAVALLETGVAVAGLSLKKALFQILDERDETRLTAPFIVMDAAVLVTGAGLAIGLLLMGAAYFLPSSVGAADTRVAIFWMAPLVASQALADILFAATRWRHAIRHEVIGRSIVEPYALVGGAVIAYLLGAHATGLIIGYWVANIALIGYAIVAVRRSFEPFRIGGYRLDRRLVLAARNLLPNTGADLLNALFLRIDIFLVSLFLGDRLAGIYGMAQQIRTPVRQVRQCFDNMLVPLVARTLMRRGTAATVDALGTAARLILSIQAPIFLLIVGFGASILGFFGSDFPAGYAALVLLTAAEAVQGSSGVGDLLFVFRSPKSGLWTMAGGFSAALAIAAIAIPMFGITGAAAAMLLASLYQAMLRHRILRTRFGARGDSLSLSQPVFAGLAGLAMMGFVHPVVGLAAPFLPVLLGLVAYMGGLALFLRWSGETLALRGFAAGEPTPS